MPVLDLITKKTKAIIYAIKQEGSYQEHEEKEIFNIISSLYKI